MDKKRILIISDPHYCHFDWYGVPSEERMERLVRHVNEEYEKQPFEMMLMLGDYSLDHWKWQIKGSWLAEGKSYTDLFVKNYVSRLPKVPCYMIAGNHEQYGNEKWKELTGCDRQLYVTLDDFLFIMIDGYGADLDPIEHSDGTYAPMDVEWVKGVMAEHPEKKVVFFSHYFEPSRESDGAKAIIADPRVLCVFGGHNHSFSVMMLPEDFGSKPEIFAGNYSYCGRGKDPDPGENLWGFRDMLIGDGELVTRYIIPENDMVIAGEEKHVDYHCVGEVRIKY